MLAQLAQVDCPVVLFSGGEPLLRADLFELLEDAQRLGLRTVVSTNGILIDEATARRLADVGVSYVGISIDGPAGFHDEFRRQAGSFAGAMAGIANCRKAGVRTGIRFTITRQNAKYVSGVFDTAAEAGVRRICFYHLICVGRAEGMDAEQPSREQTREALDAILERTRQAVRDGLVDEVLTVDNHADGPYLLMRMQREDSPLYGKAKELLLRRGGNKVGEKIACVGWDGEVYADQFWRNYALGNIKDRSLRDIWFNSSDPVLAKIRDKRHQADARCLRCKWFELCRGNYRFLGDQTDDKCWVNEPACYLTDEETLKEKSNIKMESAR
jgi:radical SAM protein with 4Fe4S-binding SPASM domain